MFTRPRIIPVLLINNRDLVKTINFKNQRYLGDPVNAVKIFNRKAVDELSILDISATRRCVEPDYEFLADIASEAFMPLSYGGGVSTIEQVKKLFAIGYEKVIINTALEKNSSFVRQAVSLAGSQSIVASIDVKMIDAKYKCVTEDGQIVIDKKPVEMAKMVEALGVGEIFLNSIDRDGTMSGYDIELINKVASQVKIPVIACGGARDIDDLKKVLVEGKAHAAAAGSMFVYYGRLKAVLITAPDEKQLIEAGIYNM